MKNWLNLTCEIIHSYKKPKYTFLIFVFKICEKIAFDSIGY
jgi:hypothetical protein